MLFEKILSADYDFPDPEWTHVSEGAKNFIRRLIVKEPERRYAFVTPVVYVINKVADYSRLITRFYRYTASQALEDPWLREEGGAEKDLHNTFAERMKKYNEARRNAAPV